nr:GntR family transcriptional regulator [uncultured Cohaesibacter sp.]
MQSEQELSDLPLSDQVYAKVRELLRDGAFVSGQRISEAEICDRFQVSRTPAREAIRRLLNEGFLTTVESGRIIVAPIDIERAEEIYDMREAVECLAAKLAAKKATTKDLIELRGILDEQRRGATDETDFLDINDRFHRCVYKIASNRYLLRSAEILLVSAGMIRGTTQGRYDYNTWSLKDHEEIYQAIEDGNTTAAEDAARCHVRRGRMQRISLLKTLSSI